MPSGYHTVSTFNPQQAQGFEQLIQMLQGQLGQSGNLFGSGSSYLQNLLSGSPEAFEQFEAPIKRQFHEETIPGIAELFSGLGSGSQSSSAFQQALGGAGADLSERLASMRGQLQLGALPHALQYSQGPQAGLQNILGLNTQAFQPKQNSFLQQLLLSLGPAAAQAAVGFLTGGPAGAVAGGVGGLAKGFM